MSEVVQEQIDRKMAPFYWVLITEMWAIAFFIGIALMALPFFLFSYGITLWAVVALVIGFPIGAWSSWLIVKDYWKRIQLNTHFDMYRLYPDHFEFRLYDFEHKQFDMGTVNFSNIKSCVVSKYVFKDSHAFELGGEKIQTSQSSYDSLLPALYFVCNQSGTEKIVPVFFQEADKVNLWLKETSKYPISLYLTLEMVSKDINDRFGDKINDVIRNRIDELYEIEFTEDIQTEFDRVVQLEIEKEQRESLKTDNVHTDPHDQEEALVKKSFSFWFVILIQAAGVGVLCLLKATGIVSPWGGYITAIAVLLSYVLYIYWLRKANYLYTIWFTLFSMPTIVFSVFLFAILFGMESGSEFFGHIYISFGLSVVFSILFYWLAKWIRNKYPASYHET